MRKLDDVLGQSGLEKNPFVHFCVFACSVYLRRWLFVFHGRFVFWSSGRRRLDCLSSVKIRFESRCRYQLSTLGLEEALFLWKFAALYICLWIYVSQMVRSWGLEVGRLLYNKCSVAAKAADACRCQLFP